MRRLFALALMPLALAAVAFAGTAADKSTPQKQKSQVTQSVAATDSRQNLQVDVVPASVPATVSEETAVEDAPDQTQSRAAAAFSIDWYSVNGGGTVNASSPNYQMGLSVGQAVAGEGSSTNYNLGIGFWYGTSTDSVACPIVVAGDVNADAVPNAADVITLVNWIFKSLGEPLPCAAAGDVDCNGLPTAADIITEVNFVFKSQALPCHACDSPLASAC